MQKKELKLYVVSEKQYGDTSWGRQVYEGVTTEAAKRRYPVIDCNDAELEKLPSGTVVMLLGSSLPFITQHLVLCGELDLRPIVAGFEMDGSDRDISYSYITINRKQAMYDIVKNLIECGATRVALLGINSSVQTDRLRLEGWSAAVRRFQAGEVKQDVFYADAGLTPCMEAFWEKYTRYDAVACANDYYAANLIAEAGQRGIAIPDRFMVTGFGDTEISRYTEPTLTTVVLNLSAVGTQAVSMYRTMSADPDLVSCSVTLKSRILHRKSTKTLKEKLGGNQFSSKPMVFAFEPSYEADLRKLYLLERAITEMDETDKKLIAGLKQDISYSRLAEKLFLSDSAFKYRLNKLYAITDCHSRQDLVSVFVNYIPGYI